MAARKRRTTLNDKWRERIQTSMLVNRLNDHVVGKVEMSATQLRAAEILLKKTAPDLQSVTYTDPDGNSMAPAFVMTINATKG